MKLAQLTVAALCVGMTLVACQKDKDRTGTKQPVPVTEKADDVIDAFFKANRADNTQTFQFNASDGSVLNGSSGTIVTVQAGALRYSDGTVASGMVTARMVEVQTIAQQALFGFPTQNVWDQTNPNGGGPIETGGSLELTIADQNGTQLTAQGNGVTVAIPTNVFDPNMRIWKGVPSTDQPRDNVWAQNPNEAPTGGEGHSIFNWLGRTRLNIDKLYATCTGTPTPFKVDLPAPFVKTNTEIYVVAQVCGSTGPKAIFALDMYNASPKFWFEHTAAGLPVGLNVDFVAIAKINGVLYYKIENATIVPGHFQHMTGMMPISLPALTALLNSL